MSPFTRHYWPWLIALVWLIGYELAAIVQQEVRAPGVEAWPTLSQLVWHAHDRFAALPVIVVPIVLWLLVHFFVRQRRR